ncbi:right-handed parallel beta-helix repeat-containing protein [Alteriqipengyuania flavescens]|uniref:right-handed parallel beta-helix repeat-containing protein n=1 Tax=Alteriqipengyuania flavescens TaxID=3053610 RepID=UPI0025B5A18C|nr:right-handed parallel beta-helix repeat-containing protein [Alteriqipengyuania flavescens]WJY19383.1 right-handed parallel beta-helix repeat-containing protein [Alteriqipengyuania flavescens]WJY25325.1 right-handed parallel beta-helix repeat-containing protein [Alteriqipengyuania flavescens]
MQKSAQHSPARVQFRFIGVIAALAVAAIPMAALLAQPAPQASGPFTVVETGQGFQRLQDAVDAIGDNTGSIAIAPGAYRQCAVQTKGDVSYLAEEPGRAVFDGETCEGKAALVLRGRSATVSGLTFAGMHVREFNGAGIRIEKGNLTVVQSWFRDSDQGILSARDASGTIVIDKSTFTRLGTCDGAGGCAHSIYIGDYGALRVTRSRFEEGRGGHYVKSRTPTVQLASNSFDDSAGKGTNYMIDLPAGSRGQITNNWFVQGVNKENYGALIAVAAEGRKNSSAGLTIAANDARLAPGARKTLFVADWSGDTLGLGENTLGAQIERYERIR